MSPARPLSHLFALLVAQTLVVWNDNAGKLMLFGLGAAVLSRKGAINATSALAVLLVLPFILFAPVAGWLADRYPKTAVIRWTLAAQGIGIGIIGVGIAWQSYVIALVGFGLLALQSCFFSPAKQGILKELVGVRRLGFAVGLMELLTIGAILLGGYFGGLLFDRLTIASGDDPWLGGRWMSTVLAFSALLSLLVFLPVSRSKSGMQDTFQRSVFFRHFHDLKVVWRSGYLRCTAVGIAGAWFIGSLTVLVLMNLGHFLHEGEAGAATESGFLMALLGAGVVLGSGFSAQISRYSIQPGYAAIGVAVMLFSLLALGLVEPGAGWFRSLLVVLGIGSGLFIVPLNALLQERSPDGSRGRILSASNLLVNIGGVVAVILQWMLANWLELTISAQFIVMAFLLFPVAAATIYLLRSETAALWLRFVDMLVPGSPR